MSKENVRKSPDEPGRCGALQKELNEIPADAAVSKISDEELEKVSAGYYPAGLNAAAGDAVSQVNTKVVGESPYAAMGEIYSTMSHATGIALEIAQQQLEAIHQAGTIQGVCIITDPNK